MSDFTPRERQVLECVGVERLSYSECAAKLGMAYPTVVTYVRAIHKRIGPDHLAPREAIRRYIEDTTRR